MTANARGEILARIRTALKDRGEERPEVTSAEWMALPREYDQCPRLSLEAKLALFEERLRDYDSEVARVAQNEVAGAVEAILTARGNRPTLLSPGLPADWVPANVHVTADADFTSRELDHFDGVVTGASVGIAETGSLVLQHVPGQGRRALTLVPDFHLCIVRVADVVENVPEAFARLAADPTLPITFISGPSATADIEMTRIKGVHGPRFLHVLLVTGESRRI